MHARTLAFGVFSLILASCAQQVPVAAPVFLAKLSGNNVVPAVSGDAWGFANASFDGTSMVINGNYYRLSGKATSIELRKAKVGQNSATVVCALDIKEDTSKVGNGTFSKTCTVKDQGIQEDLLKTGQYYVTVSTASHTDGELRGQLGYE
ncbi:CHRD domain-containing protein [Deinococcus roseus]|uniref:CHRD domain-containing protein n=1 Tax=Deinococcus roseus TaxID=392414 RepID=A0ABQ2CW29_9DEIO|nr:CHRD domain-containing protein [Deinococcus roseus]GGJ26471.1 hypothetical protein GCM10008938_10820 [Deinococcus roseus]